MHILSIPQITAYIKDLVELDPILRDVWIRGEVTNLSRSAAGHMYFCLVGEGVQLNCVLFRGNQFGLLTIPRNGDEVLAHGRVSIYEPRGQYQLIVDNVAPEGVGILQLQFEETKRRLEAEGLFAEERKRPLPYMPAVIGVVTSAQGAVWHDIQTVIARRFPLIELILAPSAVQGPHAADELVAGLQALQDGAHCDVIIIARGGGAAEDLAPFSDERLARAIFGARVPIVSAVGHETDTCIADLVADVRAPTPSAAAELCAPNGRDLLAAAGSLVQRSRACAVQAISERRDQLDNTIGAIDRQHPRSRLDRARQDIDHLTDHARARATGLVESWRQDVDRSAERARLLDPRDILRRGYAIVTADAGRGEKRVRSSEAARDAGVIRVTFADGSIRTTVQRDSE